MELDLNKDVQNFRFNFIANFWNTVIVKVIGKKTEEFLAINERIPYEQNAQREAAYIELMKTHMEALAENNEKWKRIIADMFVEAEAYHRFMTEAWLRLRGEAAEAIRRFDRFESDFTNNASSKGLLLAMAEYPHVL